jgi:hypothetical protein
MSDQTTGTGAAGTTGNTSTDDVVHTAAEVTAVLEALKAQGISDLDDLVKALVKKAHEVGSEDDVPDTVDVFIHEHYVLYHDDTHLTDREVVTE